MDKQESTTLPNPRYTILAFLALLLLILQGCGSTPPAGVSSMGKVRDGAPTGHVDFASIPDAVPKVEPPARWGNAPYTVFGKRYQVLTSSRGFSERGLASWYGTKYHGRTTSSGEVYDMYAMTAAHRSLPLPTYLEVTNLDNRRTVIVKVNDRGPFHGDRILDLSYAAAGKLGILRAGTAPVAIRALDPRQQPRMAKAQPAPQKPQPAPADSGRGYLLQIGAFTDRYNADSVRSDLERSLGYRIHVRPGGSGPRPVYRVQIGPLNYAEAEAATGRLAQLGYTDTRLIID